MFKKLIFAVLLISILAGCKSKDAFNYSESFVKKEQSLAPEIARTEANVKRYFEYQQYDSIAVAGEKMESQVDAKLKEIINEKAPNVKEADNFKLAGIKYFEFYKSIYTVYKEYGKATTEEGRSELMAKLLDIVKKRPEAIADVKAAQQKFADANGFRIK